VWVRVGLLLPGLVLPLVTSSLLWILAMPGISLKKEIDYYIIKAISAPVFHKKTVAKHKTKE
jgi:hypothetical protein